MRRRPWNSAIVWFALVVPLSFLAVHSSVGSEVSSATTGSAVTALADKDGGQGLLSNGIGDEGSPSATILASNDVRGVLGSPVRSAADEDMGRIVDIIVDRSGTARAAVIDFGGFLGVGSRKIAVDWNAMRFGANNRITLAMTRDQVKSAPQYEEGKPVVVLGASESYVQSRLTERMPER
jgi:hypothetical protein